MSQSADKVQFFQSESSFGSQSDLSDSRYYDFTNQIIAETDNIFLTLQKDLIPNESQLQKDKINYILSRAKLIFKDTIPEHINYLNRIDAPNDAKQDVRRCSEELKKLFEDYEKYQNGTMIYKQFYNLYNHKVNYQEGGFSRKKNAEEGQVQQVLQPQCIQINYNAGKNYNATPRVFMPQGSSAAVNEKEVGELREQVTKLNKTISANKRTYQIELYNQKIKFQKRLQMYLRSFANLHRDSKELEQALEESRKMKQILEENIELQGKINEYEKAIEGLRRDNSDLKSQVEVLRKTEIDFTEQNENDISVHSIDVNEGSDRKLTKKYKNVLQENKLLKNQLKIQRQRSYRQTNELTEEERSELQKNRKTLQRKNKELDQLYENFDKVRIELVQMQHNIKCDKIHTQNLQRENEQLKKNLSNVSENSYGSLPAVQMPLIDSRAGGVKTQIQAYEGDGIEGYPYYEILSKQFRIRFKRACLREKELLYKEKGVEIGVITEFEGPNRLHFKLFITNFGEETFSKLKGKIMNANNNLISGDSFEFMELASNEQVKVPVTLTINYYPLGPLILLLQYHTNQKEEIRILLPAHIFKTMVIQERKDKLKESKHVSISTERKIAKEINDLRNYFGGVKPNDGKIRVSFRNDHTHTVVLADFAQNKDKIDMFYEHTGGNQHIADYLIKTLTFLLSK